MIHLGEEFYTGRCRGRDSRMEKGIVESDVGLLYYGFQRSGVPRRGAGLVVLWAISSIRATGAITVFVPVGQKGALQ